MATGADLTIGQVAADLGLHTNVLSRWCREQKQEGLKAFRGQGIPRDEVMAKLKRELAQVKREPDFLKDAAVFFARDTPRGMP
ncbi:MAG: transposase [Nitrospirales bacterium]|nr:MAG: transposase [Nitrospirales bacterium]